MRSKSPAVMDAIRTFVDNYYRENHVPPSLREIALGVGVSKATTYRYLVAMNQHGTLSYDGKTITTKQMGKCATKYFSAPVVGSIRCGDPEREEELVEEYVSLPTSLFGEGDFYILRASGDSMVDAGTIKSQPGKDWLGTLKTEQVSVRIRHPLTRSYRENSQQADGNRLGCERQRASSTSVQPQNHAMGAAG